MQFYFINDMSSN